MNERDLRVFSPEVTSISLKRSDLNQCRLLGAATETCH